MKWSISKSKMFYKCQRKWFYYDKVASWNAQDELRREAYILKQLKSIYAWRGSLVDTVIEKLIVPQLKEKNIPTCSQIENYTLDLIERQLNFAKEKKYRENGITKSQAGDDFCALYEIEYETGLDDNLIDKVVNEIFTSLKNLLKSNIMPKILENSTHIYAQPVLHCTFNEINIIAHPDLIIFFYKEPPLIIDWKVHFYGDSDAWLQLGIYAYVFMNSTFNDYLNEPLNDPTKIRLMEYQLLKDFQRDYNITLENIADIEDYIFKSTQKMNKIQFNSEYDISNESQYNTAIHPKYCVFCNFRKLCWEKKKIQKNLWEF